jgi:hypothetical protein
VYSTFIGGGSPGPATAYGTPGATFFVAAILNDAYGNIVVVGGSQQVQVGLTPSGGLLSATQVYIAATNFGTNGSLSFGYVAWTLPTTLGTYTVTATAVVAGTAVTGVSTVSVVSKTPTMNVKSPAPLSGFIYSNSQFVTFSGKANVSLGYPSTVTFTSIGYKVGSASWQTSSVVAASKVIWSVPVTFPTGLSTVQFNATDSKTNTVVTSSYQVLVDNSAPTIAFTTAAGATLTSGQPLAATITDTLGDLNATSVKADRNGTAIPASSITVTGTNNPGSSVTYTVSITGLPAGKWKVTLNAKDLAGNAATAVSLTATFVVLTNQTFTTPSGTPPTQSTQSGFTGVSVTWTNNAGTSQTVNIWFVAYNAKNQVVFASFTQLTFGAGASAALFQGLSSSLPSGTYTVQVFVVSTTGTPLSTSTPVTVAF